MLLPRLFCGVFRKVLLGTKSSKKKKKYENHCFRWSLRSLEAKTNSSVLLPVITASAGCSLPLKHVRRQWCVEEGGKAVPAELRPGSDRGTERAADPSTEEPDTLGEGSLVSNSWPFRTLCSERSGKDLRVTSRTW